MKMQRLFAAETIGHARAAAEIEKIRAAAHRRVLAEIDEPLVERFDERARPAAETGGLLEDFDAASRVGKRLRRPPSRQVRRR